MGRHGIRRIHQDSRVRQHRQQFLQQCDPFLVELGPQTGVAGEIAAGAREALDEAGLDGVIERVEDDRDRGRDLFRGLSGRRRRREDHIDLEPNQIGRQGAQARVLVTTKSVLDGEIFALDPAQLAQLLPEDFTARRETLPGGEVPHTRTDDGVLRLRGNADRNEREATADERAAVHYSMT